MLRSRQAHALFRWHKLKGCEHFSVYAQTFLRNTQTAAAVSAAASEYAGCR